MLELFSQTPIKHEYASLTDEQTQLIQSQNAVCEIISKDNLKVTNGYFQANLPGTNSKVYTRQAVFARINKVIEILKPHAGLAIFDAFRTIETQAYLFQLFREQIKKDHPEFNEQEIELKTREFVSHPTDKNHWEVPLHNSGGAIDLEIYDLNSHQPWDFGTAIDAVTELSHTNFFENDFDPKFGIDESRWLKVRKNRRILFNAMKYAGFTNYHNEWWHYDIGDCCWAKVLNTKWIFDSMEFMVKELYQNISS